MIATLIATMLNTCSIDRVRHWYIARDGVSVITWDRNVRNYVCNITEVTRWNVEQVKIWYACGFILCMKMKCFVILGICQNIICQFLPWVILPKFSPSKILYCTVSLKHQGMLCMPCFNSGCLPVFLWLHDWCVSERAIFSCILHSLQFLKWYCAGYW